MKLRKGDQVKVLSGKDKGKVGEILSVHTKDNKVVVLGVNRVTRHLKARSAKQPAGRIETDLPIDASNVVLVHSGEPTRVGYRINEDGTKVRIAKKTGKEI